MTGTITDLRDQMSAHDAVLLARAVLLAEVSRSEGNHPFGAVLAEGTRVLLTAVNSVITASDPTGHAEVNLVRAAGQRYDRRQLTGMTLYSNCEPCAMCAGAIYWSGIGRVVYALSERELLAFTGSSSDNPTMSLPCRDVFAAGQRVIEVIGPIDLRAAREIHEGFWRTTTER